MKRLAIFKVGTHTATNGAAMIASAAMLQSVADNYTPATHEAPAVIGHPKDNHPAYAWVESLSFDDGEGVLYANFSQVEPQFAQLIQDGRFKKRSASFYPPNHPSNPTPSAPYLRHVGFLGAQPPAIKGLKDFTDFSDAADLSVFEFSELTTGSITQNQKDNTMDNQDEKDTTNNSANSAAEDTKHAEKQAALDEKEKALATKEAAINAREAAFAKQEQDAKENDFSEFADTLIKTGQLVPAEKNAVISVMMDLDGADKTFDFAENGAVHKKSSVDVLKGVLGRLGVTVDFSERSGDDPNGANKPQHNMNPADNDDVLHKQIQDYAEKNNVSFAAAAISFS